MQPSPRPPHTLITPGNAGPGLARGAAIPAPRFFSTYLFEGCLFDGCLFVIAGCQRVENLAQTLEAGQAKSSMALAALGACWCTHTAAQRAGRLGSWLVARRLLLSPRPISPAQGRPGANLSFLGFALSPASPPGRALAAAPLVRPGLPQAVCADSGRCGALSWRQVLLCA